MSTDTGAVKVAVEGCGHGTLDAIYASVNESCKVKGWDDVDLVIIGGDFQAVRNQHDLNVTAMPAKYRKMADFHKYYSGAKSAPYLTIFIGGNHEASNHLFELYYGGWVAPNIYYLGAANILRFGPLRIAGLSGIWDHRDVHKPHFERLPYNDDEMRSIYHVRELDVRKLLSFTSQVDIGLSHDWPQGVEWLGDHELLFRKKGFLREDAETGKLGSVAARHCLDRLRPAHWFSAHLHVKYPAIVDHGEYVPVRHSPLWLQNRTTHKTAANGTVPVFVAPPEHRGQVQAWQNFPVVAQVEDAAARERHEEESKRIKEEEERTGMKSEPGYTINETFKQVKTDESLGRMVTFVQTEEKTTETTSAIPNLDGCSSSRMKSFKRRREVGNGVGVENSVDKIEHPEPVAARELPSNLDGTTISSETATTSTIQNPDEIDIDMSDEDDNRNDTIHAGTSTSKNPDKIKVDASDKESGGGDDSRKTALPSHENANTHPKSTSTTANARPNTLSSEDGGVALDSETHVRLVSSLHSQIERAPTVENGDGKKETNVVAKEVAAPESGVAEAVPEDIRAQLAELSADFAPVQKIEVSAPLPLPASIINKTTKFLALSKCERNHDFLQLMKIEAISENQREESKPLLKLSYDPEWLAILRVFAPELALGGQPNDPVPWHRGDKYYRDRINEEKEWIDKNVVQSGQLVVPENFVVTAPSYDPSIPVNMRDMPREITNPQTSTFCALIGIDNPFDTGEEERDARAMRPERQRTEGRGRGRDFNRTGGRNRGGRGRRGGGGGGGGGGRGWH